MPKLKLSELKKLEWNPRTIKKEDLDKLTKSIEKFWVIEWRPFLVSNRTGENIIIWGNQRYEVCKKLGITEVPVHIMEWLTEEEEKEIIIRDNISNWEWDWDILANEWDKEDLEEWGLDVTFDTVEPEAEEDDFEVDEGVQTDIVLGDLFEIWPHRLLCWDSTNIDDVNKLMNGEKADILVTDPPYWINLDTDYSKMWWTKTKYSKIKWDEKEFSVSDIILNSQTKEQYIWWWDYFVNSIDWMSWTQIIWAKMHSEEENKVFWSAFESLWVSYKTKKEIWFIRPINQSSERLWEHPTQKPIECMVRCIKKSKYTWWVIDLFWWSGSTMVACHQLNRKCYMSELDPKYVQTIVNRMQKLDPSLVIKRNWVPYSNSDVTVK